MKNLPTYDEFLNEAKGPVSVATKDWDRMMKLALKDDDGARVAKSIKNKDKAIARYVAGLKLNNSPLNYEPNEYKPYNGMFRELGRKALELGATPEEIQDVYDRTELPAKTAEKYTKLSGKKLDSWVVGDVSQAILDAGYDIEFLPHNGYAMTMDGKDAMERNGRKWTIGYKTEVDLGDKKVKFFFDVITDESVDRRPNFYVLDQTSNSMFDELQWSGPHGKKKWIAGMKDAFEKYKNK